MTVGPLVGMGPVHFQRNKIHKCSERKAGDCDSCCKVIPCTYCLTFDLPGEPRATGTAHYDDDLQAWIGSVGGNSFIAWWERNYNTDECEFVVFCNDEEVFRDNCYGDISCRDASGSAEIIVEYDVGTLSWNKLVPRRLPYVIDESGCRTWFCGNCECICECLCVTVTVAVPDIEIPGVVCRAEVCDTTYDECDAPRWEASLTCGTETIDLSFGLDRDEETGQCLLTLIANGIEQTPKFISCGNLSASWELPHYVTIEVACKLCDCTLAGVGTPCCPDRQTPRKLYATYESVGGTCDNLDGVVIELNSVSLGPGDTCWEGDTSGVSCGGQPGTVHGAMACWIDEFGEPNWIYTDASSKCTNLGIGSIVGTLISCNPFEVEFALGPGVGCCEPIAVNAQVIIRVTE